ncbi:MAG: LysR substrate-binding domain-containing protein [Kiloniellales bacterium]
MQSLRARLPPIKSLVVFEASARHLSFTRAGQELRVSREAVSRQIRILESHLGVKLFVRLHRALELTQAGEAFHAVVRESLESIARSTDTLQRAGQPAKVTVTATIAITSYWLTPRLPKFRAEHPDAEIRIAVSDAPIDMAAEGIDVGLRYGDGRWPGIKSVHLFDVNSFPVCSPGYVQNSPPIEAPADLVDHTLLNLDGTPHAMEDWNWWLAGSGVQPPASLHILGFDSYANVIQAALDGQGIALGFSGVVSGLLSRGQLVRPMERALSKGYAVYLVVPSSAVLTPNAQKFYDWIRAEACLHVD